MGSNKKAKQELIRLYGKECFIEKLHLRPIEDTPRKYTSKGQLKRMKELTYHHIRPKSKGGRATKENGALLSAENHRWFHQQPEKVQRQLNDIFQEYKQHIDECKVTFVDKLDLDFSINALEISIDEKCNLKFNRAKEKKKAQELIDEYYDDYEK